VWPARLLLHRRRPGRRHHRERGAPGPALHAAPRPRRERGLVGRPGGVRLQPAVLHRHREQPPADALRRRPVPDRLQRRDLQLPRAARGAGRGRRHVRHRGRHRGDRRRVPPVGRGRAAEAARDVRLHHLGHRDRDRLRRPRSVRHQAAVHRAARRRRHRLQLGEEGAPAAARRQRGRRRGGRRVAAALPDAAVRPRAGDPAHRHPPDRERHQLHRGRRRARHEALLPPDLPDPAGGEGRAAGPLRPDRRRPRRLGAHAHAGRRHRGLVPLRRHRLHGDRGAGQALQPEAADLHHGVRAAGLLRDRRRGRVRRGDRCRAHHQGRHAGGVRRRDPAGRLVPRRPGRRPGPGAAVLHRPRGPQAREGRALRRGRRRAVRRLQHLPGAALPRRVREAATRTPAGAGHALDPAARRHARQGPAAPRVDPAGAALLRQRPHLPRRRARLPGAPRPRPLARGRHRRAVPAHPCRRLRRHHRHAVRRPVHLAARRHPGQGRQDDDGQLAGAPGALPRPGGLQGRGHPAGRPAGDQGDDEVRAAASAGADRPAARAQPPQAGLPRPDPALARRAAARLGAADHRGQPDRRVAGPQAGAGHADRAPGEPAQRLARGLLPQAVDAAGLHGLARRLRRGAHQARHPRDRLPGPPL
ncbi:MAG: Asparagine synthetase [glutamine-hydrolyzing] AsnB, partial [uncultured Blastococcus sp.]